MFGWQSLLDDLIGTRADVNATGRALPVRAFAWARVSTSIQEEHGLSIPEQLRQIREYARARNIDIVAEFSEAESAFQRRAKRPEF